MSKTMQFTAPLVLNGKTATGIEVPATIVDALGAGKKPPVRVTLNGHTYRSTVASRGGRFLIGVSAENRDAAGVSAGETLRVDIEVDHEPREVPVPPELVDALASQPGAKATFDALSPSKKQQLTLPIERAKTNETRRRNVAKALDALERVGL
jgi:hypothetical protein